MADDYHFVDLTLENVRAFGGEQTLDLRDRDGNPSRWCVVLGSNGVGKSTVMQALAVMKPVNGFERVDGKVVTPSQSVRSEAPEPDWTEPDIAEFRNDEIVKFVRRREGTVEATMQASLVRPDGKRLGIGFRCVTEDGKMVAGDPIAQKLQLDGEGPLVIGYGAARHSSERNMSDFLDIKPTLSLFDEKAELLDPQEVIGQLYLTVLSAREEGRAPDAEVSGRLLETLRAAMLAVVPDEDSTVIHIGGPRPGSGPLAQSTLRFETPSGLVAYPEMSLGYRTTVSWIVDLGYRLSLLRPKSEDPLRESAIVLIDEIDLHLHPSWQRELRGHLLHHFPNVQFIVTTHSPIIAQEAAASRQSVAVIRWEGTDAVILNDPIEPGEISYNDVVKDAFGLETELDTVTEDALRRRQELLLDRERLGEDERRELAELERKADRVRRKDAPGGDGFEALMRRVIEEIGKTQGGHE